VPVAGTCPYTRIDCAAPLPVWHLVAVALPAAVAANGVRPPPNGKATTRAAAPMMHRDG
jgi:hypothetical protein